MGSQSCHLPASGVCCTLAGCLLGATVILGYSVRLGEQPTGLAHAFCVVCVQVSVWLQNLPAVRTS